MMTSAENEKYCFVPIKYIFKKIYVSVTGYESIFRELLQLDRTGDVNHCTTGVLVVSILVYFKAVPDSILSPLI
jgi:hypothetical protein